MKRKPKPKKREPEPDPAVTASGQQAGADEEGPLTVRAGGTFVSLGNGGWWRRKSGGC